MMIGLLSCLNFGVERLQNLNLSAIHAIEIHSNEGNGEVAQAGSLNTIEKLSPPQTDDAGEEDELASQSSPISLIRKYFPENFAMAIAIARAESNLEPARIGDKHLEFWKNGELYGHSVGIFQIRRLEGRPDINTLLDAEENVKFARQLYEQNGWNPWSVYRSGRYKQFLEN